MMNDIDSIKLKLFDQFVVREKYGFGRFRLSSLRASDVLGFPAIFAPRPLAAGLSV